MGLRRDYQQIGDLVLLCAQTMKRLSAEKRKEGLDCPFKQTSLELEALSVEIKEIAADLPPHWDRPFGADLDS